MSRGDRGLQSGWDDLRSGRTSTKTRLLYYDDNPSGAPYDGRPGPRVYCWVQTHTLGPQYPGIAGFKNVRVAGVPEVAV